MSEQSQSFANFNIILYETILFNEDDQTFPLSNFNVIL